MESLRRRLQTIRSPLIDSAEAMDQLQRQLGSVLDDVENLGTPAAGSSSDSYAVRLSEEIGTTRATQGVRPVESARAAIEMFRVLLPVVTEELTARGMGDAGAETAALALHNSIMRRVGLGALAYANYLLKKVSGSHRDERHRIARELHDSAAHSIGVALQSLELYQIYVDRDPELARQKIVLAREVLHEALTAVQQTAQELHDGTIECGDVGKALRDYLSSHVPAGVDTTVSVTGAIARLPVEICEELYIVLREAIRNAVLHSGARSIRASVNVGEDKVHAAVEDDGHGFDVARALASPSGIGLLSMRERVELLAGELTVTSADRQGTTVSVVASWSRQLS
jgi:signal transduction histidine kinase